jgi:hypothetical protein
MASLSYSALKNEIYFFTINYIDKTYFELEFLYYLPLKFYHLNLYL